MYIVPPSRFDVRLISPISGMNFLGRVEVNNSNVWGTVCDNSFDITDANVICNMLNYRRAICAVHNARLGRGRGEYRNNVNHWESTWSCETLSVVLTIT